ncbi:Lysoplasmalogenase-like protein TMEM86A [Bagarius yarrelli]|uniref:lysoplasmalogenase n=1 Tax=Bagarius yarrelli TaxID=175774 RepID=A0A556TRI5_BAGYA|nr:Lysoplasmalogenase-like protein TMEM86A [Bagarius yarrelli]
MFTLTYPCSPFISPPTVTADFSPPPMLNSPKQETKTNFLTKDHKYTCRRLSLHLTAVSVLTSSVQLTDIILTLNMVSPVTVVKSEGPKLVPFFKATCVYFVLWLPTSSPSWFSALIKCLPIFCLWVFLLAHGISFLEDHSSARKIFAGLIFSALGDAFLIWQEQGYFSHGLLMFAITHILYSSAFGLKPLNLPAGLVIGTISGLCYALLYPYLSGTMTYLVAVYIALIGFMGWRAIAGVQLANDLWTWTKLSACLGAVLFMVSDLTIAVNKFCFPVPHSRAIIMATYYAAQMLIALSAVECQDADGARKRV